MKPNLKAAPRPGDVVRTQQVLVRSQRDTSVGSIQEVYRLLAEDPDRNALIFAHVGGNSRYGQSVLDFVQ